VDKAAFAKIGLALAKTLDDLAKLAYKSLLVVQTPLVEHEQSSTSESLRRWPNGWEENPHIKL
jgi:hypothetical protein